MIKDLLEHVERVKVTQGAGAGSRLALMPWQRRFLRGCFSQDGDAALSVARGAGKSTLCAAIADAALCGPLRRQRAEVVIAASSFSQARIVFEAVVAGLGRAVSNFRVQNSQNLAVITCPESGARVRVVGSDPRRMHGLQPLIVIVDEPAQHPPTSADAAIAALRTSLGKVEGSRLIAIGTRPASAEHWFSRALDGRDGYAQVHAARASDPPFRYRTWVKACPSLPYFPALRARVKAEAEAARLDPSLLASFRALRLNLGVSDVLESMLLEPGTWAAAERVQVPAEGPFVLGLDLGTSAAMSAAAAFWPATGRLDSLAVFPEQPSLAERGRADNVRDLYSRMAARGELLQRGELVSSVPGLLTAVRDRWGVPRAVVCDRWREAELRQCLEAARFPAAGLIVRGQGFKDGGQDLRAFRRAVVKGRVRPVVSLLLRSAMAEARAVMDPAGNAKLGKRTEGGRRAAARDDAAAAAILAVAAGVRAYRPGTASRKVVLV